jgi:hypothetical protein
LNNTHVVIANGGAFSKPMSAFEAYKYSRLLKEVGNYDIWVTVVSHAEELKARRVEGESQ